MLTVVRCLLMFGCFGLGLNAVAQEGANTLVVDADFPGGNIIVDELKGNDVYLHQDLRDTAQSLSAKVDEFKTVDHEPA